MNFVSPHYNQQTASSAIADGSAARTYNIMTLSKRMRQVAAAIALGRTSKEIGDDMGLSVRTVDKHRQKLMKVFALRNSADITRFTIVNRIIQYNKNSRWIMEYPHEYYNKGKKTLVGLAPKLDPALFNLNESK